jgi:hypothetical protein
MRFTGWLWVAGAAWASVAWGQVALPPRGTVLLPKSANLATDQPIDLLQEYARNYQALKAGRPPVTLGLSFLLAQSMVHEPRTCMPMQGMAAFTEFSTSFQRLAGRTDSTMASNREVVLTSIARYSCADADTGEGAHGLATVPGYEMMSRMKGTYAEAIAPRKRTVLPGMSSEQAAAFEQFGDVTQRFRTDPAAAAGPGTIAGRMADLQEVMKLPPEERKKAVDELNARYAKEKPSKAEQAKADQMSRPMIEALSARGQAEPKPLAFLQLLQEGEAYVDLYKYYAREGEGFGLPHYLAVISDGQGSRLVRLGPAEPIDMAVAVYIANTQDGKTFESSWKDLQRLVIQPLLGSLPAGSKMLWVSPDSDLFGLPFASLMLEVRADLSVTVVPSAYDFSRLASLAAGPPTGKALLVGDLEVSPAAPDVRAVALADITSVLDGEKLQVQKLSGRDATLANVMTGMKDAQYILFSTHGRWANAAAGTSTDAFGSAGIELWGEGTGSSDSVLTAADIVKADLSRSDLVVLLACETAQGQAVNGQGSLGFQSAFMASGVRSLLVALWRVPADASKELVQNFYSGLFKHHLSRTEALKQAQSALRRQPRFADPWNWGGWVLVGDPRPVPR